MEKASSIPSNYTFLNRFSSIQHVLYQTKWNVESTSCCSFICPCSESWEDGCVSYTWVWQHPSKSRVCKNTVATWHTGRTHTPTRSQDDRQRKMNGRLATLYLQWLGLGTGGHWETVWELRWQWTMLVDTMWVGVALGWGEGLRRVTVKLKIGWETDRDRLTICVLVAISWGKEEKQKRKERQKGGR